LQQQQQPKQDTSAHSVLCLFQLHQRHSLISIIIINSTLGPMSPLRFLIIFSISTMVARTVSSTFHFHCQLFQFKHPSIFQFNL
jgi:hypothetical protein